MKSSGNNVGSVLGDINPEPDRSKHLSNKDDYQDKDDYKDDHPNDSQDDQERAATERGSKQASEPAQGRRVPT